MLNFLSKGNQRQIIGISLTPGIGLEAVILDRASRTILGYAKRKVEYNFSTREIQDILEFKTAVIELMNELQVPLKSYVYIVLPNVYFDFTEIPLQIDVPSIKQVLLSRAEDYYLFKRTEPVSGYSEIFNPDGSAQRRLAFASFQKNTVTEIKEVIAEIGLQIAGIESNYSATLRGLYLTGLMDDMIEAQASWTIMLINSNSYTFFQMDGKNLIDYSETPLAIKSFSQEEAYQVIASGSSQLLNSMPFEKLYIISQTDEICAEILKRQIEFNNDIVAIDTNKYSKEPLLQLSPLKEIKTNTITLGAIGATSIKTDINLTLNVLADDPDASLGIYATTKILGVEIDITNEVVKSLSVILSGLLFGVFAVIIGLLFVYDNSTQSNINQITTKIQECDARIAAETSDAQKPEVDMSVILDDIVDSNIEVIKYYDSIATDIPKNVWLTKYYSEANNKLAIKGLAESIEDIYGYYKNLRLVAPTQNIKLTELRVITQDSSTEDNKYIGSLAYEKNNGRLYSFEISNTDIEFDKYDVGHSKLGTTSGNKSENDIIIKAKSKPRVEATSDQMRQMPNEPIKEGLKE